MTSLALWLVGYLVVLTLALAVLGWIAAERCPACRSKRTRSTGPVAIGGWRWELHRCRCGRTWKTEW